MAEASVSQVELNNRGVGYSFGDGAFAPVSIVLGGNAYIKQAGQFIVVSRSVMRAIARTVMEEESA